jgi:hypothetical protein
MLFALSHSASSKRPSILMPAKRLVEDIENIKIIGKKYLPII